MRTLSAPIANAGFMTAQLIDGKALASQVKTQIRAQVEAMTARGLRRPGLARARWRF